ncbi:MAG: hypothetical protein ACERKV_12420 [Clostridiaceae bacterium]
MSKLSKNEKILLVILGVAIVIYLYYTFFLTPVLNTISTSKENITSYNTELDSLSAKEVETGKMETQYDELKVQYDGITKRYPKFEKVPQIAYDIKIIADKNNIELTTASFGEKSKVGDDSTTETTNNNSVSTVPELYFVPLTMNISGSYINAKAFIKDLENETRSSRIVSSTMNADENEINVSIISNMYFITDPNNTDDNSYDFNNATYGKSDLFN